MFSTGNLFGKYEANSPVKSVDLKVPFGCIGAVSSALGNLILWRKTVMGLGPRIMGAISRAPSGSGGLASLPLWWGQPQGNVRWHWVSLSGLMHKENQVPDELTHFYIVPFFNRPDFRTGDVWWRHWREKEGQHMLGCFESSLSFLSFCTFIHLIQQVLTEQLLCDRVHWGTD